MAKVIMHPREEDLLDAVKGARERDEARLAVEVDQLDMLTYGYFRFREIQQVLQRNGLPGGGRDTLPQVCMLIGKHQALESMAKAGFVPRGGDELTVLQDRWRQWALCVLHGAAVLERGFHSSATDEQLRDAISQKLGSLEGIEHRSETEIKDLWTKRVEWEDWAARLAPKCTSSQEQRDAIEARWRSG